MNLCIDYFDIDILKSKKSCLILGDNSSGKSILIKNLLFSVYNHFPYGFVFSDTKHFNSLYSLFLKEKFIYKRYSTLLAVRCFINDIYLVLDNYYYNKEKYTEIFDNCKDKNILLLVSLSKLTDFKDYDYIFLCKFTDIKELYKIYKEYIEKFKTSLIFEQFIELVNSCTNNYEVLVINCKAKVFKNMFFSYIPDLNTDFQVIT